MSEPVFDPRSPSERMAAFAAELEALEDYGVEQYSTEVAVVQYGDEDTLGADLTDLIQKGHDYSLVVFDGEGGEIVTLHFKPVEAVYADPGEE